MPFRRRRRSGSRRSSSPARTREWFGWETLEPTTNYHRPFNLGPNQSSSAWLIEPQTAADYYDEPTVVRLLIRQWLRANPTNNLIVPYETHIFSGIIVARGIGAMGATLPAIDITTGQSLDWMWYQSVHFTGLIPLLGQPFAVDTLGSTFGPYQGVIDIKSKRKIPIGFGLAYFNYVTNTPDNVQASVLGYTSGRGLLLNN